MSFFEFHLLPMMPWTAAYGASFLWLLLQSIAPLPSCSSEALSDVHHVDPAVLSASSGDAGGNDKEHSKQCQTPVRHSSSLAGALAPQQQFPDDNAPRLPPRPGDSESHSEAMDVLPGADAKHLHGLLGRLPDGSMRMLPKPLPTEGLTDEERRDAHRGFAFNSRVSDSVSVDRDQADARSPSCIRKHRMYPKELPSASVVIVFHNEHISVLLRTVHSVLNHSPPRFVSQVILVDDASMHNKERFYKKHWLRLQEELTEYCKHLPKVLLVRLAERRGLMVARMEGAWRATGDVLIFLDSHVEATPGWIEPLLARVKQGSQHVVLPRVDSIGNDNLVYGHAGGLSVISFSWTLGQQPWSGAEQFGPDDTTMQMSPIMSGGLFAHDRRFFLRLGGYDQDMRLYGGEETEISFRIWMCGGKIEHAPCSHVGHIFRSSDFWEGQVYVVPGGEIARNKLRAAEVWMDRYKSLVKYATMPLPPHLTLGDLEPRKALRRKLGCKSFTWYLQHVVPDKFVPKISADVKAGALWNPALDVCVDTLGGNSPGQVFGAYPCHGQHGTQALVLDDDGLVRIPLTDYLGCLAAEKGQVIMDSCMGQNGTKQINWRTRWKYSFKSRRFGLRAKGGGNGSCLETVRNEDGGHNLLLAPCGRKEEQVWIWN